MEPYWNLIEEIVRESDIILYILDARAVRESRNKKIEETLDRLAKPYILVLNKADLVGNADLESAVEYIRVSLDKEAVYFSNRRKSTSRNLLFRIRQMFARYGKRKNYNPIIKKPHREAKADIVVGVVGYPNVGKSSVINALAFKKKAKVSEKAGTTHGLQWISAGDEIKLIDTPGVIPLEKVDRVQLGFISAISPDRLKEPELVAGKIIETIMNRDKKILEERYNISIKEGMNAFEILEYLSLEKKHLKKGGFADEIRTSRMLIKDWQNGSLRI
jgi:ribosome biogenesis GTPase A